MRDESSASAALRNPGTLSTTTAWRYNAALRLEREPMPPAAEPETAWANRFADVKPRWQLSRNSLRRSPRCSAQNAS